MPCLQAVVCVGDLATVAVLLILLWHVSQARGFFNKDKGKKITET